jgi:endonuclease/exonuclease/phosphatase family metal-dependent hydrolase
MSALLRPGSGSTPAALRVATFNIRHGLGMDGRLDIARTAAAVAALDCDLVAVQEVDVGCARSGRVDQAAELARLTGMTACFGPAIPLQGGLYGILVLSRLPVTLWSTLPLPGVEPRCLLTVDLAWAGSPLRFCATHLDLDAGQRLLSLPQLRRAAERRGVPFILAGDLNATPDTELIQTLVGAWQAAASLAGPPTYPADVPTERIDYLLPGPAGTWQVREMEVIDDGLTSDHRPVRVTLERTAADGRAG